MATIRLSSAGTGKSIEAPDTLTVAELREIADVSDDIKLAFNGEIVQNEDEVYLQDGDTVIQAPKKISHG
jgi:hypothetical protein